MTAPDHVRGCHAGLRGRDWDRGWSAPPEGGSAGRCGGRPDCSLPVRNRACIVVVIYKSQPPLRPDGRGRVARAHPWACSSRPPGTDWHLARRPAEAQEPGPPACCPPRGRGAEHSPRSRGPCRAPRRAHRCAGWRCPWGTGCRCSGRGWQVSPRPQPHPRPVPGPRPPALRVSCTGPCTRGEAPHPQALFLQPLLTLLTHGPGATAWS